ncbi:hypothetical protein Tco_0518100 [Tanacetum coccineum]
MAYFRSLHSHLQVLSKADLKGTHVEHGFRREFMSIFGQDVDTFTRTMLLNVDQLQKQLDKDEFQQDGSMTAFWVVNNQFQKFFNSKFTLDYDNQMTETYFVEYIGLEVQHFRDTLLQHLSNVKKSVAERKRHQRQYERRVNKRQMQTQESKIDTGKALDADLVDIESIRTDSTVQDDSSRPGNLENPRRIFKTDGLRWIPTGKIDSTLAQAKKEQSLGLSAVPVIISDKGKSQRIDQATRPQFKRCMNKTVQASHYSVNINFISQLRHNTTSNDLDLLFGPLFDEYFNGENQVVLKSSAVTTTDASNKRQQQPDSTSSTSTLATTVTANGNFDL